MPCRDDDCDDHYWSELSNRNHELAAELCKARGLLLTLSAVLDQNKVSNSVIRSLQDQLAKYRQHREQDKLRATLDVERKRDAVAKKISLIKELGGLPSTSLLEEIDAANTALQNVKNSDPLETDLY
jgi:hypothetical protein